MNDEDNVIKILDNRTPFQAGKNYQISKENEQAAMEGLVTYLNATLGLNSSWSEIIDDEEKWGDGKFHIKPDYSLFIQRTGAVS